MKLKSLFLALCSAALLTACDKSNDTPTPTPPASADFDGLLFATSVTNPEGASGSCYLQAVPNLNTATYDNSNAIPTGFGTPIIVNGKNVYVLPDYMGQNKAVLTRYKVNKDRKFIPQGELTLPGGAGACNVVQVSNTKAYVAFQNLGKVMVFNPTTMTKTGEIDLNSLAHPDTRVAPATMLERDGLLYVGLSQFDAQWMPNHKMAELALIDTKTDKFVKHIKDEKHELSFATRPIDPYSMFMDEAGDIYVNCIGSFGLKPGFKGGILRIRKGQTDFDPDYVIDLSATTVEGLPTGADFLSAVYYGGNGKLYAYVNSYKLDPAGMSNPYGAKSSAPAIIDLKTRTIRRIMDLPISNPHAVAVYAYKGKVIFGSANEKASGFYVYDPATGKSAGPVITVKGNPYAIVKD